MNFFLRLLQLMLRHRAIAGLLLVASVVVAGYAARTIEVRFQYRDFYDYPENPQLPLLTEYTKEFGDPGGFVVLFIESGDVFTNEILTYVDTLTKRLEALGEFKQVVSLTNARAIRAVGDDVDSGPLFRQLPLAPSDLENTRATALNSSLLVRRLVAPDSKATAVLSEMRTPAVLATVAEQSAAVQAVNKVMHSITPPPGVRAQVTGAPVVEVETTKALVQDQQTLTPAVLLILSVALALTFRSIHGIVLPLAAVATSLVWTAGVFSLLHHPLDLVGSIIPTALLVYGVVDPIFVYTRYLDKCHLCHTREQAVLEAMRELLLPCFVTSLTTALGFAAFITATLPMIRYFGIVVGLGVLFAFVTTVTVLPLLLVSVGPSELHVHPRPLSSATDNLMHHIWDIARRRPELMVSIALSMLIAGAAAGYRMGIINEYVGVLPKGSVQAGVRTLEQKLSGVARLSIYLEGDVDSMKRPEVLQAVAAIDQLAEQQRMVTSSVSLADLVGDTNRAFHAGDPKEQQVPDSEPLISQYLSLVDPGDLSDFVNSDYSRSHIRILHADEGSRALSQLRDKLQHELDRSFPPLNVKATITGYSAVGYQELDRAVEEILVGFLVAFGLIIVVETIMFRSLRVALISIVPNIAPICACFLLMRLLGLKLRVDNSLVLCISVGGLFNTTIHIVARVLQQLRSGAQDPDEIVGRALNAVGPPSLYTALILSLGFSAMALSRFPGLQVLGLLCLVTLLTGFVCDAFLTTSFLRLFYGWKEELPTASNSGSRRQAMTAGQ